MSNALTMTSLTEQLFSPERRAIVDTLVWQRGVAWGGPFAAGVLPLALVAAALVAVTRAGRATCVLSITVAVMLVGYYTVYLLTSLDVAWLVGTTHDRLIVQIWPSLVLATFLTEARPDAPVPLETLAAEGPGPNREQCMYSVHWRPSARQAPERTPGPPGAMNVKAW